MHRLLTLFLVLVMGTLFQSNAPLQDIPDGATLFKKNCKACHGKKADKETKKIPNLLESTLELDAMQQIVVAGKETMPPFGESLNEAEIQAVLTYVQELQQAGQSE